MADASGTKIGTTSEARSGVHKARKQRESGIELLRIIAMLLIVSHHMVVHNAFHVAGEPVSARRLILQQFLCVPGKIGIALFFMISAWFMADRVPTTKSVFRKAWIMERELLFWSVFIFIVQLVMNPAIPSVDTVLSTLLPTTRRVWWYATAYMVFLLLSPFIIQGLRSFDRKRHLQCCLAMVFLWGVLYAVPGSDTNIGMNVVGFVYVFALISYYKWYGTPLCTSTAWIMTVAGTVFIVAWDVIVTVGLQGKPVEGEVLAMVEREWSIPVLIVSFGLFALFRRLRFRSAIVNRCAAATFGVYLITDHSFMRSLLWTRYFDMSRFYSNHSCLGVCARFLIIVLGVFVAAMLLDMLRSTLFFCTIDRHRGRLFDKTWSLAARWVDGRPDKTDKG